MAKPTPKMLTIIGLIACAVTGCARSELPVSRYDVAEKSASLARCVYRGARESAAYMETVTRGEVDNPKEYQVSKLNFSLVWDLEVTEKDDGSRLVIRHLPSLLDWKGDLMKSLNPCLAGAALKPV